ncbi:MAG TPA: hypothetical protein VGB76_17835 [Pyrinomonadaceae bacterium]|jgi:hypothetical protein
MSTLPELHPSTSNRILNALTRAEHERLAPDLEPVILSAGEVIYHPDQPITHVYCHRHASAKLCTFGARLSVATHFYRMIEVVPDAQ